jgi:basic membrane protein A
MKKFISLATALLMAVMLAACGGPAEPAGRGEEGNGGDEPMKMVLLVNGLLGDLAWFDSSKWGFELIGEKYGGAVELNVIEMTYDESKYQPIVEEVCNDGYDIIVAGSWSMLSYIEDAARGYPKQKFWFFDEPFDYSGGEFGNVYSMTYRQNEGTYLTGIVAAMLTATGTVGFVGGEDGTVINDFLLGYMDGVKSVNPACRVLVSYTNSWEDAAAGKEMALAQFNAGADIILQAASQAGLGVFEAAKETANYAIGSDTDQAQLYQSTDPQKARLIITSIIKDIGASLLQAYEREVAGTLPYGAHEALGLKEKGVGLAFNDIFAGYADDALTAAVQEAAGKIQNGEIDVLTAYGKSADEIAALKAQYS